jgi:hypothetical protein
MSDLIKTADAKITAEQVETDCPPELQGLAKRIVAHLESARKHEDKAGQHFTAAGRYLAEAQMACDEGGFNAFREKFCPNLRQSRAYELLSIASGTKSVEDVRAANRKRVAKHRAKRKVVSVTVTENPEATPPAQGDLSAETVAVTPVQPGSEPPEPRTSINPGRGALSNFTTVVMELVRLTKNKQPGHFTETGIPVGDLARLGRLLTELASLKSGAQLSSLDAGNDVPPDQSAEAMKAKHAADEEKAAA